ncbi:MULTISPECIES: LysR substrate-binding domain-containing protein [Pseudomonas]|uniref:LysR substrate-binding domain-containing protein n=1 Tax=Pseudomonas TaxID=286 RepID=UPI0006D44153|nr:MULTISPECIES: LysR substrate-binding domain-containing protein [Pseudomonas]MCP8348204.1 LysR family transcriptional regulator [Pseudomonas sp. FBF18]MCQ0167506.1 LysR family transcriptional regulator [Pseudomonas sp. S12(2018)]MDD1953464.1 LysR substrate-binding domain-containing protein [Pseudomonas sp. 8209]MEC6742731.1 LysR substrate-binding domain-containing protein [Pseudomonas qingdaonensis]OOV94334.1 LysR family transcriptional regulator [Pseudomonas sp. MF6396]
MNSLPNLEDLNIFVQVAKRASFAAVAEQLGMSAAFISKRVRLLEQQMGVRLLHRTTRRVSLSEEGERVYQWALQIFETVQRMGDDISTQHRVPVGQLRIASSLGLGRRFVAPALSELAERYPQLDIRLDVHDRLVDLIEEGVDLDIRVGNVIAPHLIAKPLAHNRRVLCAAPGYLQRRGTPRQLAELSSHDCLVIKERDHPFGVWQLQGPQGEQSVRVTGGLSTNHGEVAHQWCLDGRGILLRSYWDVHDSLADGRLVPVLEDYHQAADIWAVYTSPLASSAKVRVAVEFLRQYFAERYSLPVLG